MLLWKLWCLQTDQCLCNSRQVATSPKKTLKRHEINVKMSDSDEILFDDIYELHEVIGEQFVD